MNDKHRKYAAFLFVQIGATAFVFGTLVYAAAYFLMMDTLVFSGATVIKSGAALRGGSVRISYSRAPIYKWSGKYANPRPFWDYFFLPAWSVDRMLRPKFWQWQVDSPVRSRTRSP